MNCMRIICKKFNNEKVVKFKNSILLSLLVLRIFFVKEFNVKNIDYKLG